MDDLDLLKAYADHRDQEAFAQLACRHSPWLYSAARRQLGDGHLAEDATQAVFLLLSRRASSLRRYRYLSGWLFLALSYCIRDIKNQSSRRQRREQEAATMRPERIEPEVTWDEIAPMLEAAVGHLGRQDRDAVLLRFYEQKPLAEVGRLLGVSEEAARKRVERAVGRLREMLAARGVEATATGLGVVMAERVTEADDGSLDFRLAVSDCGNANVIAKGAMKMMALAKVKVAAGIVLGIAVAGGVVYAAASTTGATRPAARSEDSRATQQVGAQAATMPDGATVLMFPAGAGLGTLSVRDDRAYEYDSQDWQHFAVASGRVLIPAGKQLELRVSRTAINQLAALEALPPGALHRLSLNFTDVDDAALAPVAHLTGLRSLELRQTRISEGAAITLAKLTALESLDLENTAAGDRCAAALRALPNLRYLGLWATKISDAGLRHIAGIKNLEVLDLGGTRVGDGGVSVLGELPKLRYLRLYETEVTDPAAQQISKWTTLRELDLERTAITDGAAFALARLPHLRVLRIGRTQITDDGMADISAIKTLEELTLPDGITNAGLVSLCDHPSLKQVEGIARMDDESLAIFSRLPRLESIELRGPGITVAGMEQVAKMRSLRKLTLADCPVGDAGLARLMPLNLLEELSLTGTGATARGLEILENFKGLKLLRLGDGALVHEGLKHAAGLKSLETLCLQGNGLGLDDAVLADVGQLTELKTLVVYVRTATEARITDDGISFLARLTKLEGVHLDTPGRLTDRSLVALSQLRRLRFLRLHGSFSDTGLRSLEGMPELYSLVLSGEFSEPAKMRLSEHTPALQGLIVLPDGAGQNR